MNTHVRESSGIGTRPGDRPGPRVVGRIYVCVSCGILGTMTDFQDDRSPGWTHERLVRVESVTSHAAARIVR